MPIFKSKTIAVPRDIMNTLQEVDALRTVKAFLLPFSQIYWGYEDNFDYTERKPSHIYIKIETFTKLMGYSQTSRITTEIRNVYRKMNQEIFGSEDSPEVYFTYDGCSKDKKYFILKVHKPQKMYNISENGSYVCMDTEDVFRCQSIYDYKVLALIASATIYKNSPYATKHIEMNTYFLKECVFGMGMYENCYINKKHPQYSQELLDYIEYYSSKAKFGEITSQESCKELDSYASTHGYQNTENLLKVFEEIVTFNKRGRIENYLEHALKLINQGTMFKIIPDALTGKLYKKTKCKGYRVDKYIISVIQRYKLSS